MKFFKFKRSLKFWWQRRTRGWDDSETWNLDVTFAKYIYPRLKRYLEVTDLEKNADVWEEIMWTFQLLAEGDPYHLSVKDEERLQLGLNLFALEYRGLWW